MLLIGHRGCYYPGYNQNTIRSFEKTSQEGVPAIEFDVQLCGDGQLVILHNLDLKEVSTGKGKVITTDSSVLKTLYAGDPNRGKDRIPFLHEVLDFFSSIAPDQRPQVHLELKGDGTGIRVGEVINSYVNLNKLLISEILVSSFNWQELENIRRVCPTLKVALLQGAIRRKLLKEKVGTGGEALFERIFTYGGEQYMLPQFTTIEENRKLLMQECSDIKIRSLFEKEIQSCLDGEYYHDKLLDKACEMNAVSINLWFRTVTSKYIEKAHKLGLLVYVFTVNTPDDLRAVERMGVDGIFTDYYSEIARVLAGSNS